METLKSIELSRIEELKIVQDVRLIYKSDLNPVISKVNLSVIFEISGDVKGRVAAYLCLDGHDLGSAERNYIFPLFVEAMNILIGRQITLDKELMNSQVKLSSPKLSMISTDISTQQRNRTQKYKLDLDYISFPILVTYQLQAMN
jgi:hypothetical protein